MVIYRSKMHADLKRNFQVMSGAARLETQICASTHQPAKSEPGPIYGPFREVASSADSLTGADRDGKIDDEIQPLSDLHQPPRRCGRKCGGGPLARKQQP